MTDTKLRDIVTAGHKRTNTLMETSDVVSILQAISEMTEDDSKQPSERMLGIRRAISLAIGRMETN